MRRQLLAEVLSHIAARNPEGSYPVAEARPDTIGFQAEQKEDGSGRWVYFLRDGNDFIGMSPKDYATRDVAVRKGRAALKALPRKEKTT